MTALPAPLAAPLHILEPWPWRQAVGWLLAAIALYLLVRWWARRRRRGPTSRGRPAGVSGRRGFAASVDTIRQRARKSGRYRRGCHELALLVRQTLEPLASRRLDVLTAREIKGRLGDDGRTRLLVLVADLRFGRRSPTRSDFDGACDLALEVSEAADGRAS